MSKVSLVWLIIAIFAVINGIVREKLLVPSLGYSAALPLSGILLCVIVICITYAAIGFFGAPDRRGYLLIGIQWVVMTLLFEFIFGHYVVGKPWGALLQTFNLLKGDLFLLVLIVSLLSPLLVAKLKGLMP